MKYFSDLNEEMKITHCSCCDTNHSITVKNDGKEKSIIIEVLYPSFNKSFWEKLKDALKILFSNGRNVKCSTEFIFKDEQHIKELINCLTDKDNEEFIDSENKAVKRFLNFINSKESDKFIKRIYGEQDL